MGHNANRGVLICGFSHRELKLGHYHANHPVVRTEKTGGSLWPSPVVTESLNQVAERNERTALRNRSRLPYRW